MVLANFEAPTTLDPLGEAVFIPPVPPCSRLRKTQPPLCLLGALGGPLSMSLVEPPLLIS